MSNRLSRLTQGVIVLLILSSLVSCASLDWVAERNAPVVKVLPAAKSIAVLPFEVSYDSTPFTTLKLAKEWGSQDLEYGFIPTTVKVQISSPDAAIDYAVTKAQMPYLLRDAWIDFLKDSSPYETILSQGFSFLKLSNAGIAQADPLPAPAYSVVAVDTPLPSLGSDAIKAVGTSQNVDYVIAGSARVFAELVYVTDRKVKNPPMSPWPLKPGQFFLSRQVYHTVTVYDARTGEVVYTNKGVKPDFESNDLNYLVIPGLESPEVLNGPFPTLVAYVKSPEYKKFFQNSLKGTLTNWIPYFREHYKIRLEEVKKK